MMKNKKLSKFLCVTLAILMCLLAFPVSVLAAETTGGKTSNTSGYDTLLIAVNMEYECTCNDAQKAGNGCGKNGMCYIIRLPDGSFIIYDGGWNDKTMCDRIYDILKTCSPAGAKDIVVAGWILTHPHIDHYGAFQYMAEHKSADYKNLRVVNVYRAFPSTDYLNNKGLFDKVNALETTLKSLVGEDHIKSFEKNEDGTYKTVVIRDAKLTPIYAADSDFNDSDANASSLVSTLTMSGTTMLFTGDMTATVAQGLLNDNRVPTADYYQIPHHGCEDVIKNNDIDAVETLKSFYEKTSATTLLLPASSTLYNTKQSLAQNAYWKDKNLIVSNTTTVFTLKTFAQSAGAAWDGTTSSKPSGAGTAEDPYLIEKPSNLLWLGSQFTSTGAKKIHCRLEKDIDCGGYAMRLGSSSKYFDGTFDGNGYKISNFKIDKNTSGAETTPNALFVYLKGATIKNLTVENADIKCAFSKSGTNVPVLGGIAGKALEESTIENCSVVNSSIEGNVASATAGGIVGLCDSSSTVLNCVVSNTTVSANYRTAIAGGIVGSLTASSTIKGCSVLNGSNITAVHYIGGIVGKSEKSTVSYCVVTDSTVANDATESEQKEHATFAVGGIVGHSDSGTTVLNCINYGTVSLTDVMAPTAGTSFMCVGGIVGYVYHNTTDSVVEIKACINYGKITGSTNLASRISAGGIVGRCRLNKNTTEKVTIQNCYNFSEYISASTTDVNRRMNCGVISGYINGKIQVTALDNISVPVNGANINFENNEPDAITSETKGNYIADTEDKLATLNELASGVWTAIKENRTGCVAVLGIQETKTENGVFAMRFLMGLDSLDYSNYKFIITTEYTQNGVRKVAKNGGDSLTTVYETILAGGVECSAVQLGANYLGAMVVSGVPADATDMIVTVQAYVRKVGSAADTLIDTVTYSPVNQSTEEVAA